MKPYRILSNLVGFMLFVQVILGGAATLISYDFVNYHIYWGLASFVVLIVATVYAVSALGTKSTLFRVGKASTVDFLIQGGLGLSSYFTNNPPTTVVIHLTNAFVLGVLVTYLISFADAADKATLAAAASSPALVVDISCLGGPSSCIIVSRKKLGDFSRFTNAVLPLLSSGSAD